MKESRVVFLTGAGSSADSGIRTFRGDDGLYAGMRAENVLSAGTLSLNPQIVHRFMDDCRVGLRDVEPSPFHRMLSDLVRDYGERVTVLTQNFDDLLERAGLATAVHLHGFVTRLRSIGNSKVKVDVGYARYWDGDPDLAPAQGFQFRCPKSNSRFRPDVVLFGERAPEYARMYKVLGRLRRGDLLCVVGTQGNVLPITQLAAMAPCQTLLNNLHESDDIEEDAFDRVIMDRAAAAAPEIDGIARDVLGAVTHPV